MEFHTVYNSYEISGRDYIGKHSTDNPYDDYRGSFKDGSFDPDDKIVLGYAKTLEGAMWLEIQYQRAFKVAEDPQFANRSYQTSDKFYYNRKGETSPNIRGENNPSKRPEVREKLSEGKTGIRNPMHGKSGELNPFSGKTHSPENKVKIGLHSKIRNSKNKWWVNSNGETRFQQTTPGPDWQNGRVYRQP